MTLSRFIRDYLYIPLGGSRHGRARQVAALMIAMTLCGLWHGAGWSFVAWGALHGAGLVANLLWSKSGRALPALPGQALTLLFVVLGWVLFRAEGFDAAFAMLRSMATLPAGALPDIQTWALIAGGWALALCAPNAHHLTLGLHPAHRWSPALLGLLLCAATLWSGPGKSVEFIYFQF